MKMFSKKKNAENQVKTEEAKIDERRKEVLAKGRKFKYPIQYTKYRVVINTILIALAAVALVIIGGWLALYRLQSSNDVLYRITRVVPITVADVDGGPVRFSDYLMLYRSSITSIEQQSGKLGDDEGAREIKNQYKRAAMDSAEEYGYALKIGKEMGIEVSDEEVREEFLRHQTVGGVERSEEGFLKILEDSFGLSKGEYERMLYLTMMKARVAMAVDATAEQIADQVEQLLTEKGGDYAAVAEALAGKVVYAATEGMVDEKNIDGGRAEMAMKLEAGGESGRIVSNNGDGYYFVKLLEKDETRVNYVSLWVPFNEFGEKMAELRENEKIREFIQI